MRDNTIKLENAEKCPTSLTGCHLLCPDEVGFDIETKQLEYFCLRCGRMVLQVSINDFEISDYEILFHILVDRKDAEENADREKLIKKVQKIWDDIFNETIEKTLDRVRKTEANHIKYGAIP